MIESAVKRNIVQALIVIGKGRAQWNDRVEETLKIAANSARSELIQTHGPEIAARFFHGSDYLILWQGEDLLFNIAPSIITVGFENLFGIELLFANRLGFATGSNDERLIGRLAMCNIQAGNIIGKFSCVDVLMCNSGFLVALSKTDEWAFSLAKKGLADIYPYSNSKRTDLAKTRRTILESKSVGEGQKESKREHINAEVAALAEPLRSGHPPEAIQKLSQILSEARETLPADKAAFVRDVNAVLNSYSYRIKLPNGVLARLCIKPGSTKTGFIQFEIIGRGTKGGFQTTPVELVPYTHGDASKTLNRVDLPEF